MGSGTSMKSKLFITIYMQRWWECTDFIEYFAYLTNFPLLQNLQSLVHGSKKIPFKMFL